MDEYEQLTPEEIRDSEDTGLTAGAVRNESYREETPRERRERLAEERAEERRFRREHGA